MKKKLIYVIGILILILNYIIIFQSDNVSSLYRLIDYNYISAPKDLLLSKNNKDFIFYNYDKDNNKEYLSYEINNNIISYSMVDGVIVEYTINIPISNIRYKNVIKFFDRNYSKLNEDKIIYVDDYFIYNIESLDKLTRIKISKIKKNKSL